MSTTQIIEEIKKLTSEEISEVKTFLQHYQPTSAKPELMNLADFEKAQKTVFTKHDQLLRKLAQ